MKNIYAKSKTKISFFFSSAFVIFIIFFCGCNSPGPAQMNLPENVSVKQLVPEAVEVVQNGLNDKEPVIRAYAIEVVAAGRQIKLVPKVSRLLNDRSVPVRFAAALAIGDIGYSLGKGDVEQLLHDPDENVRIAAAYALKKIDPSGDFETVRKAITSDNQTIRANAALLLGKGGSQSDLKLLYWVLRDKDSSDKVRFQAVEAIAMLHDERIYPKIWTMLLSIYADDRVMGIKAMGSLGTQNARDALITKLDDPVLEVRLAAAEQIGALGNSSGEPEVLDVFRKNLIAAADQEGSERVKILTALAIGHICTPSVTRFLPELIKDSSISVRLAAAKAVLQCYDGKK